MKKKDHQTFIDELIVAFPEIKDEVLDEDYLGLTTLQIGCFKRFTQKAIDNNDLILVKKCFDFVDSNIDVVEYNVENSLVISYLGKLNFSNDCEVDKLLTKKLRELRVTLAEYYATPSKNEKLNKFLKDLEDDNYLQ